MNIKKGASVGPQRKASGPVSVLKEAGSAARFSLKFALLNSQQPLQSSLTSLVINLWVKESTNKLFG